MYILEKREAMEEKRIKKTYWPHAIIFSMFLIVGACVWTIKIALNNPVEMDSFYLEKYQQVDRNINTIMKKQKEFFQNFKLTYQDVNAKLNQKTDISFSIENLKTQKIVENADILFVLTRPETNRLNQEFKLNKSFDGKYILKDVVFKKLGRWQYKIKIKIDDFEGFAEHEIAVLN